MCDAFSFGTTPHRRRRRRDEVKASSSSVVVVFSQRRGQFRRAIRTKFLNFYEKKNHDFSSSSSRGPDGASHHRGNVTIQTDFHGPKRAGEISDDIAKVRANERYRERRGDCEFSRFSKCSGTFPLEISRKRRAYGRELSVKELGIDKERIWVSVFETMRRRLRFGETGLAFPRRGF